MKSQIHYNIDNINEEDALFNIIFGEKSNGKSYQVKHKEGIEHYLNTKQRFILSRRWKDDITPLYITKYFSDVDILKLTDEKYNTITSYRREIFFANYKPENDKTYRGEKIGYAIPISLEQHFSSGSFLDVDRIIYEEFFERGSYIPDEVSKFMAFYSTVDRKQARTKVYCVGNSISKINPYLREWGLDSIIRKIKQGQILTKEIDNDGFKFKIAVEYCRTSGGKSVAIGSSSGMIDKGLWQSTPQPKLPKSYSEYKVLYRFGLCFKGFKFIAELLDNKESCIWFVYPFDNEFKNDIIVISDEIKVSNYWQRNPYNLSIKNEKLQNLFNTFREDKIFFASDICGTDFKSVIDFSIRR